VLIVAASLVGMSVAAWLFPPTRARIKALGVVVEIGDFPLPRPWAAAVDVQPTEVGPGIVGDMYSGGEDAPIVLFVPGATRRGREDPRVVGAASALARAGRRVFVPELALYRRVFRHSDIEGLTGAIGALSREGPVGIVGFSYGGSFALIAAADAEVAGEVAYVAAFGAYYDLGNVIQAVTTGRTTLDGEAVAFETVPEARQILLRAAVELAADAQADELERALQRHDPSGLRRSARAVYELLTNADPRRSTELTAALPSALQETLRTFSPSSYVDDLDVPVFVMQSRRDAATPWTEAVLLDRAVPRTRLAILDHFSHVDPPSLGGWLDDGLEAWRFVSWVLTEQE
jgi:pimeloyl-ACP methyl ester carboxylesterase